MGPDAAHDRLSGAFPAGDDVISVQSEGDTAFVTLNQAFLGIPNGAPADWEDLARLADGGDAPPQAGV